MVDVVLTGEASKIVTLAVTSLQSTQTASLRATLTLAACEALYAECEDAPGSWADAKANVLARLAKRSKLDVANKRDKGIASASLRVYASYAAKIYLAQTSVILSAMVTLREADGRNSTPTPAEYLAAILESLGSVYPTYADVVKRHGVNKAPKVKPTDAEKAHTLLRNAMDAITALSGADLLTSVSEYAMMRADAITAGFTRDDDGNVVPNATAAEKARNEAMAFVMEVITRDAAARGIATQDDEEEEAEAA